MQRRATQPLIEVLHVEKLGRLRLGILLHYIRAHSDIIVYTNRQKIVPVQGPIVRGSPALP